MSGKVITNPTGAFGAPGGVDNLFSETAALQVSTAAVTAKQVVQIDPAGTVRIATTTPSALQLGITNTGGAVGQVVNVVVQGAVAQVPYTGSAPVAGDTLIQSGTTAGRVVVNNTPGLGQSVGMAIAAGSGGFVDVWVGPKYVS